MIDISIEDKRVSFYLDLGKDTIEADYLGFQRVDDERFHLNTSAGSYLITGTECTINGESFARNDDACAYLSTLAFFDPENP